MQGQIIPSQFSKKICDFTFSSGNNVAAGDEIHDYIPNFTFDEVVGPNGELLDELDVVSRPLKE